MYNVFAIVYCAAMAQSVERILGKDEVTGSIPVSSSKAKSVHICERIFVLLFIIANYSSTSVLSAASLFSLDAFLKAP